MDWRCNRTYSLLRVITSTYSFTFWKSQVLLSFLCWLVLNILRKFIKTLHITPSCATIGSGEVGGPRRIGEIFVRSPRYARNGGRPGLSLTDRQQSAYQVPASARGSTLFIPPPLYSTSYFTCLLLRAEERGELQYCRFDCGAAMFTTLNRFCCDLVWRAMFGAALRIQGTGRWILQCYSCRERVQNAGKCLYLSVGIAVERRKD